MKNDIEYIICAANHYTNVGIHIHQPYNITSGRVITGWRHHSIIQIAKNLGYRGTCLDCIQGFLTSRNKFVNRVEARKIAITAEQVDPRNISHQKDLFSEDIY